MSDFRKLYDRYEEAGDSIWIREVDAAEEEFAKFYRQIEEQDRELAEKLDSLTGKIARAYSMQGFSGGLMIAGEVLA